MIAKLLPRMTEKSLCVLDMNDNLLTSTFYQFMMLVDLLKSKLKYDIVLPELNESEYDMIISRYMGDDIIDMDKTKPIYEFEYDELNGGWFFERYTDSEKQYSFRVESDVDKLREILGDVFFMIEVMQKVGESQL